MVSSIQIIFSILSLIFYALSIYFATIIIIKYIYKYEKISNIKKHVLLLYTEGFASGLQAFLPSLFVIKTNPLLAFYMNYYNVVLDFTFTFGIMISLAGIPKRKLDTYNLAVIIVAYIALIFFFIYGQINYIGGYILILLFFILLTYTYIHGRKKYSKYKNIDGNKISLKEAIVYSLFIALAIAVIYDGGGSLNNVANTFQNIGLSIPLIGFIFALVLFTLPNVIYEIISYYKTKNIKISTSDILGEELSEFTLFIGILAVINKIVFPSSQYVPLLSSVFGVYTSLLIMYISSYITDIPRGVGIFLIILSFIIGFLNINVIG